MNKFFKFALSAVLFMGMAISFSACSDDNDETIIVPIDPIESDGVFVLNQGQYFSNIEGMLTYFDYEKNTATNNLFTTANQQSMGNTPQCGVVCDDHLFIGVSESQVIWMLDDDNATIIRQIKLGEGENPRSMVYNEGYVYVSLYNGYVAKIDSKTGDIVARVQVGPNPEIMAIYNGSLYVPNSDGMNYPTYGTTASVIDLASFTITKTIEVPVNPNSFYVSSNKLYVLSMGNYYDVPSAIYEVTATGCNKIAEATLAAASDDALYIANFPYTGGTPGYTIYNTAKGTSTTWTPKGINYPSGIGIDPINGNVVVGSFVMDGEYPSYSAPGFAVVYKAEGTVVKKFDVGAGPTAMIFDLDD